TKPNRAGPALAVADKVAGLAGVARAGEAGGNAPRARSRRARPAVQRPAAPVGCAPAAEALLRAGLRRAATLADSIGEGLAVRARLTAAAAVADIAREVSTGTAAAVRLRTSAL